MIPPFLPFFHKWYCSDFGRTDRHCDILSCVHVSKKKIDEKNVLFNFELINGLFRNWLLTSGASLSSFFSADCGLPSGFGGEVIPLEGRAGCGVFTFSFGLPALFVVAWLLLLSRGGPGGCG